MTKVYAELKEKPRKDVNVYYDEAGNIKSISVTVLEGETFITIPWETGKLFLSGERSPDDFYVNEQNRLVKNLPTGVSRDNRHSIIDLRDSLHDDYETADVVIIQSDNVEIEVKTTLEHPLFITMYKNPLYLFNTVLESTTIENISKSISIYTNDNNKDLKVYYDKYISTEFAKRYLP